MLGKLGDRRQGGLVDEGLGAHDRFLLKACHAPGEAINEGGEFRIGNGAVDVAVAFGEFSGEVIGADQDFERPAAADKARQARHGATAGDCAAADQLQGRPY